MIKQIFSRGLLGFPIGIAIGYVVAIVISVVIGQGEYFPCVPSLIDTMGNETNAVTFQAVLSGILGITFGACSVIWDTDWSIVKQTGIYFLITAFVMMPVAYFTNWMEHSLTGFITYFAIFLAIFVVVWCSQFLVWKNKVKKLNQLSDVYNR